MVQTGLSNGPQPKPNQENSNSAPAFSLPKMTDRSVGGPPCHLAGESRVAECATLRAAGDVVRDSSAFHRAFIERPIAPWLSGWPKKSSTFKFTTKTVPKSLKCMNSGSEIDQLQALNQGSGRDIRAVAELLIKLPILTGGTSTGHVPSAWVAPASCE